MLTKYEQELVNYWKNWKPSMAPFKGKITEEKEEKHTKKSKKEKRSSSEIMEEIQL